MHEPVKEKERTDPKMKAKRRRLEAGFKARVGLEALKGIKTVAQIAWEYCSASDENAGLRIELTD
jgi:hypothetical protein